MNLRETDLPGVVVVTPKVFQDDRGLFFESYNTERYRSLGIECDFLQDNVSFSSRGVVRGLHYQMPNPQAKLVQVLVGSVLDVAVDIRVGSPTFGKWIAEVLSAENHAQLFIPAGFAHGFAVLGEGAMLSYKCSTLYDATGDSTVLWNDPSIGIEWPYVDATLSAKDLKGLRLEDIAVERLPVFSQ